MRELASRVLMAAAIAAQFALCLFVGAAVPGALGQTPAHGESSPDHKGGSQAKSAEDALSVSAERGGPTKGLPLPRFAVVWEGKLSRSGNSKEAGAWEWLRGRGVNGVVNFRERNNVDYDRFGFKQVLWIPLANGALPTEEEAEHYLRFIQEPANQPVHVYCAEGKDRTGMMIALARYAVEGWTMDAAIAEARLFRRGEDLAQPRIDWLRAWEARHKPGSHRRR